MKVCRGLLNVQLRVARTAHTSLYYSNDDSFNNVVRSRSKDRTSIGELRKAKVITTNPGRKLHIIPSEYMNACNNDFQACLTAMVVSTTCDVSDNSIPRMCTKYHLIRKIDGIFASTENPETAISVFLGQENDKHLKLYFRQYPAIHTNYS